MTFSPEGLWPDNKRCAVALTVLFDDGLDVLARYPSLEGREKSRSIWDYGARRGVDRLLQQFADTGLPSTWFIPGSVIAKHRTAALDVVVEGHEIAARGVDFEDFNTLEPVKRLSVLKRNSEIISELTGKKTRGFRLPQGMWPFHFDELLVEAGFDWSASLNGDDLPYQHASSLVQIPVHLELEDRPYFQFCFAPAVPKGLGRIASYDGVLHNWMTEFDAYHRYGLCYVLQLRPEMIATPGHIFILEKLLEHIQAHDDVWFASGSEIADWTKSQRQKTDIRHPINVFEKYYKESGCHE
ncbi:polysaccharide deacetylase family protein [Brucellaceae bacterium C25G]